MEKETNRQYDPSELTENLGALHTTPLGARRISRNVGLDADMDAVDWCKAVIAQPNARIWRQGKNWYAKAFGAVITVNAHSMTIITAHMAK